MGLLDFTSKVLTEYKADVSDHKAKIKELTGAQKELAKEELKSAEARNKQLEDHKSKLGQVALAVGATFAAVKIGQAGLDEYIKHSDLAANVSSQMLGRLKDASGGLRTEMDLLSFSARTNHGAFKLTADQQELTLKAMRALEKQGYDSAQVFDAVTKSVTEANTNALEPFGIQINATGDKAEKFKAIMSALGGEVARTGGALDSQSDDAKRLGVQWDDAMSNMKIAIGEIVVSLGPLISAVAQLASSAGDVVRGLDLGGSGLFGRARAAKEQQEREGKVTFDSVFAAAAIRTNRSASYSVHRIDPTQIMQSGIAMNELFKDVNETMRQGEAQRLGQDKIADEVNRIINSANEKAKNIVGNAKRDARNATARFGKASATGIDVATGGDFAVGDSSVGGMVGGTGLSAFGDIRFGETQALQGAIDSKGADMAGKRQSKLEAIFGPLSDFNSYAAGFALLKGAVESSFGAWIDGSKGAAQAAKEFAGSTLKTIALTLLAESIKETAYGFAALTSIYTAGLAPGHFVAAAKYAGGAALIGGIAHQLGGGGGGASGASTGGGSASSSSAPLGNSIAAQPSTQRPISVLLGDEYAADSPRRRQQRAASALQLAKRGLSNDDGVIYG